MTTIGKAQMDGYISELAFLLAKGGSPPSDVAAAVQGFRRGLEARSPGGSPGIPFSSLDGSPVKAQSPSLSPWKPDAVSDGSSAKRISNPLAFPVSLTRDFLASHRTPRTGTP